MFKNIIEYSNAVYVSFLFALEMRKPKSERDEEYLGVLTFGSKEKYHQFLERIEMDQASIEKRKKEQNQ